MLMTILNCLILGDAIGNISAVDISQGMTVGLLKERIRNQYPDRFANVGIDKIQLFKVLLPIDNALPEKLKGLDTEQLDKLSPIDEISALFEDPPKRHLHVIVSMPAKTSTPAPAIDILNCLIFGDAIDNMFEVYIPQGMTVMFLKDQVRHQYPSRLANVDVGNIQLFKVLLPVDNALPEKLKGLDTKQLVKLSPIDEISALFEDFPKRHLHVIVSMPTKTSMFKRPRSLEDESREVLARRQYINKVLNARSPSTVTKSAANMQSEQEKYPLYNGRPHAGPPLSIYEPIFATIDDKLRGLQSVDGDSLLEDVATLVSQVNQSYTTEDAYQKSTVEALGKVLGVCFTQFVATGTGLNRTTESDAIVSCPFAMPGSQAISAHVEWKLEIGLGGDGQFQNALSLRKHLLGGGFNHVVSSSCCPTILITIAGPYIAFAGFIFTEVAISQPFTTYLPMILKPGMEQANVRELSKYFRVFRDGLSELEVKYKGIKARNDVSPTLLLPQPKYLLNDQPPEDLQFLERFRFDGLAENDHSRYLFKALYGGKLALVKFGERYGKDAHELLANSGLAPKLYCCIRVGGGLTMVVMEFVDAEDIHSAFAYQAIPQQVIDDVKRALKLLHGQKLVFGDLRQPNILVSKVEGNWSGWVTRLVDFSWAGTDGIDRYPPNLNLEIHWHPDVKPNGILSRAHDLFLLDSLCTTANTIL